MVRMLQCLRSNSDSVCDMDNIDYNKLSLLLQRYATCTRLEGKQDDIDLGYNGMRFYGKSWIEMDLKFYSYDTLCAFYKDLLYQEEEKIIRSRNPSVQQAYEEYQILLKLSK